ncbi:Integrase [Theobroma cacao]|nr:Integrase [Theobroma cacao]
MDDDSARVHDDGFYWGNGNLVHVALFSLQRNSFSQQRETLRYTWVYFLAHKNDALHAFLSHCKKVENEKGLAIVSIRSDHGGESENDEFEKFCNEKGLDHNFSAPRTPQQNGVVERKNRTLKEMARTMLCENNLPKYLWADAVNTTTYILNRVSIRPLISKTPYELYKGRKPNISHLRSFGCKCFVLNNGKQPLGKFDAKSDEAIFLEYALNSKAYRVFNKRTLTVEESIHAAFDESNALQEKVHDDDYDVEVLEKQMEEMSLETNKNNEESSPRREDETPPLEDFQRAENQHDDLPKSWRFVRDHPQDQIIGEISQGVKTRKATRETCEFSTFIYQIKPKNFEEAEKEESWIMVMQEELDQFTRSHVWSLVPRPSNHPIVGTKWVFRNKVDEQGNIVRNKASAFLNGLIQEEVYVEQPPGFEDFEKSDHVFKLHKALYGLKQASRAWYERLSKFLVEKGYDRGSIDTTLFIKRYLNDLIVVQIYVDDIVFGATNEALCKNFAKEMQDEFEMSMLGKLKYFLGFQIKQSEEGIFINQERYTYDMLKKFDMLKLKSISTPMSPSTKLDLDEKGKDVDQKLYKGTIGFLLYLTVSRSDIQFSVCLCARFQSQPKESHLTVVKRIFRYLIDTRELGIWYSRNSTLSLVGYSDADFTGSIIDRKALVEHANF